MQRIRSAAAVLGRPTRPPVRWHQLDGMGQVFCHAGMRGSGSVNTPFCGTKMVRCSFTMHWIGLPGSLKTASRPIECFWSSPAEIQPNVHDEPPCDSSPKQKVFSSLRGIFRVWRSLCRALRQLGSVHHTGTLLAGLLALLLLQVSANFCRNITLYIFYFLSHIVFFRHCIVTYPSPFYCYTCLSRIFGRRRKVTAHTSFIIISAILAVSLSGMAFGKGVQKLGYCRVCGWRGFWLVVGHSVVLDTAREMTRPRY